MTTPPPGGRHRRRGWWILGSIVLIVVAALVAGQVSRSDAAGRARDEARAGVEAHRAEAQQLAAAAEAELAPLGTPTARDEYLVCRFTTRDSGWIPSAYQQECEIRTRLFYPVTGSAQELNGRLPATAPVFTDALPATTGVCPILRTHFDYQKHTGATLRLHPAATSDATAECVLAPPTAEWAVPYRTADIAGIDRSKPWVVATLSQQASRTELGCAFPSIPLCNNPLSTPALP